MRWTLTWAGDASPDEVWKRYAELERWPAGRLSSPRSTRPAAQLVAGLQGVVTAVGGLRICFEVLAVDPAKGTWRWRAPAGSGRSAPAARGARPPRRRDDRGAGARRLDAGGARVPGAGPAGAARPGAALSRPAAPRRSGRGCTARCRPGSSPRAARRRGRCARPRCRCRPRRRRAASTCTGSAPPWNQIRNASSWSRSGSSSARYMPRVRRCRSCQSAGGHLAPSPPNQARFLRPVGLPGGVEHRLAVPERAAGGTRDARRAACSSRRVSSVSPAQSGCGVPVHPGEWGSPGSRRCCCRCWVRPQLVAGGDHRQRRRPGSWWPSGSAACRCRSALIAGVVGLALDAAVPGPVVVGAVAVGLAVRPVVLDVVGDQVAQREAVVGGDEVDAGAAAAAVAVEDVGRARSAAGPARRPRGCCLARSRGRSCGTGRSTRSSRRPKAPTW